MGRNACLAIGISDAPPLDYLPGAVNGAKAIADWATKAGYETKLLIDSEEPVGIDSVANALTELLPHGTKTDRLILYFAGHGLARDAAEDLWLLSQWKKKQRAIAVGGIKRKLERYGIEQIAIISDACRSLPPDANAADLTSDNVLDLGPYDPNLPLVDMLKASSKFRAAYMIPGATPEDDRCIFTGVIEEALWGHRPSAFHSERKVADKRCITSGSLAKHLRAEVPAKAEFYKVELRPDIISGFLDPDDIYVTEALAGAPAPRGWPDPAPPGAMGLDHERNSGGKRGWSTRSRAATEASARPTTPPATFGGRLVDGLRSGWMGSIVPRPRGPASIDSGTPSSPKTRRPMESPAEERDRIERERSTRKARASDFFNSYGNEDRPTHFETGSGFSLWGAKAERALVGPKAHARRDDHPDWWRVESRKSFVLEEPVPLLIELDDGRWLGSAAIPKFIQTFTVDQAGAASVIYRPVDGSGAHTDMEKAEKAVADLRAGIGNSGAAYDYALELRWEKHQDPILGVLAAYLYDSQGDVESIRQIAYFYAHMHQPIPFDVAMLARIKTDRRDGLVVAQIPAVKERPPRTESEAENNWSHYPTSAIEGVVAGAFPWLRQGWSLVDDRDQPLMLKGLEAFREHLTPAPFTTLTAAGGAQLGKLIFGDDQ